MNRQSQLNERIEDIIAQMDYREVDLSTLLVYAKQAGRTDLQRMIEAAQKYNQRALAALRALRGATERKA